MAQTATTTAAVCSRLAAEAPSASQIGSAIYPAATPAQTKIQSLIFKLAPYLHHSGATTSLGIFYFAVE
jgi:hypothetical protein